MIEKYTQELTADYNENSRNNDENVKTIIVFCILYETRHWEIRGTIL